MRGIITRTGLLVRGDLRCFISMGGNMLLEYDQAFGKVDLFSHDLYKVNCTLGEILGLYSREFGFCSLELNF